MKTQNPKSNRLTITVLVVLCAALAGWVIQSRSALSTLEADNADIRKKLDTQTKLARIAAVDAASWRRQMQSALGQAGELQQAAAADADKSSSKRNFSSDELAALGKNPALQSIIASQQSAVIGLTYSAMLDHFKLAPDERDYMGKLLIEKQMVQVNLGMRMMDASLPPEERMALGQQIMQGMRAADDKIHSFLNDDQDFAYYQSYAQQEPERLEVGMFTQSLGSLDAGTSEALANLLSDSRNNFAFTVNFYDHKNFGNPANLNTATFNKFFDEQAQFQAAVADKAAGLLTPAQQEAFKQNQAAVRQMMKMQLNSISQLTGQGQ